MRREIKFKCWSVQMQEMFAPESIPNNICDPEGDPYEEEHFVHLQYTGLKDKAGNEIYEGDILKVTAGHEGIENRRFKVSYREGAFGLQDVRETDRHFFGFTPFIGQRKALVENGIYTELEEHMETVGNIYQNPELLNQEP